MTALGRILVVEDDVLIAMDLEDELADRGFKPVCVSTFAQAQRLLDEEEPTCAVLDMYLRSGTTFDLAAQLQSRGIPLLFLSGNNAASLPEELADCTVISKPVQFEELVDTIRSMIKPK